MSRSPRAVPSRDTTGTPAISAVSDTDAERARALFFDGLDHADRNDHAGAEERFRQALLIVPDRPSVLTNLAGVLLRQNKTEEALEYAKRALRLEPDNNEAALIEAACLRQLGAFADAAARLETIVAANPDDAESWATLGTALAQMRRYGEAAAAYREALAANPDLEYVPGDLVSAELHANEWPHLAADVESALSGLRSGHPVVRPFQTLMLPTTPADQLACARQWCAREYPRAEPLWRGERYANDRIRIAYVSADFGQHPTAQLMVGLFEQHDRKRFEIIAIATEPDDGSPLRARMGRAFDQFVEAGDRSDREIARLMRDLEIDIAVDLNAHTTGTRIGAFALRPAPVQVSYLIYPGTTGAGFIDYLIADRTVVPEDERQFYAEKIVWMPETYFVNDDRRGRPATTTTRADHGLPADSFVFCSFNNSYKFTPDVFDVWMRLLCAVEGSVLWLLEGNADAAGHLRREAQARGVDPARLVFAPRVDTEAHLARQPHADLFLDTLHYNAHTTACEAMWMGLPVLTCRGKTFASRVGASLAGAIGLPEMVTETVAEYEARALELARDRERLAALRARLATYRATRPLFDTRRQARHLELAYVDMHRRHRRGERPAHIHVPTIS